MNIAKTIRCLFRDKMLVENVIATNNLCLVRDKMPRVATYSVPTGRIGWRGDTISTNIKSLTGLILTRNH